MTAANAKLNKLSDITSYKPWNRAGTAMEKRRAANDDADKARQTDEISRHARAHGMEEWQAGKTGYIEEKGLVVIQFAVDLHLVADPF